MFHMIVDTNLFYINYRRLYVWQNNFYLTIWLQTHIKQKYVSGYI